MDVLSVFGQGVAYMNYEELKRRYKYASNRENPNLIKIPVSAFKTSIDGVTQFNEIYHFLLKESAKKRIRKLNLTSSGGIATKRTFDPATDNLIGYRMGYIMTSSKVDVILLTDVCFRFQLGITPQKKEDKHHAPSRKIFSQFKKELLKNGINLDDYAIKNGMEVKQQIPKPLIMVTSNDYIGKDKIFENVHHIDFKSSYAAGLVNTHPEFAPTIQTYFNKRFRYPSYKLFLNIVIGYMQSRICCKAKWAHLSRDAIKDNIQRVEKLAYQVQNNNRQILLFNTDGFWYQGDIYHGDNEGNGLGQWYNDYVNCKFRMKSKGAYEFITPDGKYHPVVRGLTNFDTQKPREDWVWGDIFQPTAEPVKIIFNPLKGAEVIYE